MAKAKSKRKRKLSNLQERFKNNILEGMNQTDAYLAAGYKCSRQAANANAVRLIANDSIQKAIKDAREKAADKAEISQERILREEGRLSFLDPMDLVDENGNQLPLHKLPNDVRRAIVGLEIIEGPIKGVVKYKYKFSDKGKSLERISKHLGMYTENINLGFGSETLNAILAGLPDEYATAVRTALGKLVSKK